MPPTALPSALAPAPAAPAREAPRRRAPAEADRVRRFTAAQVNRAIDRATDRSITRHAALSEQRIRERIAELELEWDVDRVLEAHAAVLGLAGMGLARSVHGRWLALPAVALVFLLQHSLMGWCPALPLLRRLGVRTRSEIEREKYRLLGLLDTSGSGPLDS